MNFLAHLHLAHQAKSSLLGNLMADFVKGSPINDYAPDIVAGIMMHRRVDATTDTLGEVKIARTLFLPEHHRVAPITLDIIWDHFLARHWSEIEPTYSLSAFNDYARATIEPQLAITPAEFQRLNSLLWPQEWLIRYADMPFIKQVLCGMAKRRPKLSLLEHTYWDLEQNYTELEALFWRFYPEMVKSAQNNLL